MLSLLVVQRAILRTIAGLAAILAGCALAAPGPAGPGVAGADPAQVLIVGDSLAVGMVPYLSQMITDRQVTFDAKAGWTTPQGMNALRHDLHRFVAQTYVISLGTNDGSDPGIFANRIHRILNELPSYACVVWPAISRPPRKGKFAALNRVLRDIAREDDRVTVIDWDRMVAKGTVRLPDGVHPDADGYRFRSWVTAAAVHRGCPAAPPA